jgi:hypothetical protein
VAEMCIAGAAQHLGSEQAVTVIWLGFHALAGDRRPETGPAGAGFVFGVGAE